LSENIPVLGFFLSGGLCRRCGHPFSFRYAFVELLTGVLALAVYSVFGMGLTAVFIFCFVCTLIAISFIDLDLRLIPDSLSIGGWVLALFLIGIQPEYFGIFHASGPLTEMGWSAFMQACFCSILGYGLFWLMARAYYFLRKEEGLGGGDLKLMGLIGAVLGLQGLVTTILVGSLLGALLGLANMILRGQSKHSQIPFGPFLSMGALLSTLHLDRFLWP